MKLEYSTPIRTIPMVGPSRAASLEKLGIYTVEDLLYHVPHRYNDYSLVTPIHQARVDQTVTIKATVDSITTFRTKTGRQLIQATVHDDSGKMTIVWFNQTYLLRVIREQDVVSFSGTVSWFGNKIVLSNPQFEIISSVSDGNTLHTGRIVAVYPETEGITSKWLRNRINFIVEQLDSFIVDELPDSTQKIHKLVPLKEAIQKLHFPTSLEDAEKAKRRIAFDELLFFHVRAKQQKRQWEKDHTAPTLTIEKTVQKQFLDVLPFTLTDDQQSIIQQIEKDITKTVPMNRLLVGDVGSGKTVIAAYAMLLSYQAGFSSVLMAPTQILAEQHYATISKLLAPLNIPVDIMTGATKTLTTEPSQSLFSNDTRRVVVGTHALLTNQEKLGSLGVVIIDEQHRFGVRQRGLLTKGEEKGRMPHLLTMTATPIPRTIAKTLFGNLDISFLMTQPKGRQKIKTWLVPNEKRKKSYEWIRQQIRETQGQVFIICPFIESSETMVTVKAVTEEYEVLQKIFPEFSIGLLHGRMKAQEKTTVLDEYRDKKHHILLATPVVEVGIDIPNANIMVIEAAERFGLGQLHQLRGRVGRGKEQSYCLLFTEATEETAQTRLKAMELINNGPELAELDLRLRGAGDIFGTKQHGIPVLKVANLTDTQLLSITDTSAETILDQDPELTSFPFLREKLKKAIIEEQIQD